MRLIILISFLLGSYCSMGQDFRPESELNKRIVIGTWEFGTSDSAVDEDQMCWTFFSDSTMFEYSCNDSSRNIKAYTYFVGFFGITLESEFQHHLLNIVELDSHKFIWEFGGLRPSGPIEMRKRK